MGRLQHQRSVRAPAGASDGNDITAGEGTREADLEAVLQQEENQVKLSALVSTWPKIRNV